MSETRICDGCLEAALTEAPVLAVTGEGEDDGYEGDLAALGWVCERMGAELPEHICEGSARTGACGCTCRLLAA